jgi:hypothetical protein
VLVGETRMLAFSFGHPLKPDSKFGGTPFSPALVARTQGGITLGPDGGELAGLLAFLLVPHFEILGQMFRK